MEITASNIMLTVVVLLSLSVLVGNTGSRFGTRMSITFRGKGDDTGWKPVLLEQG